MQIRRMLVSATLAGGLAALPLAAANAQYYEPCPPFPLFWPFCIVGAVVGTAAAVVTAPFRALAPPPYPYYGVPPYYPPPPYAPPPPPYAYPPG